MFSSPISPSIGRARFPVRIYALWLNSLGILLVSLGDFIESSRMARARGGAREIDDTAFYLIARTSCEHAPACQAGEDRRIGRRPTKRHTDLLIGDFDDPRFSDFVLSTMDSWPDGGDIGGTWTLQDDVGRR